MNPTCFRLTHSADFYRVNTPFTNKFKYSTPHTRQTWRRYISVCVPTTRRLCHWKPWATIDLFKCKEPWITIDLFKCNQRPCFLMLILMTLPDQQNNNDRQSTAFFFFYLVITAVLSLVCYSDSHLSIAVTYEYDPHQNIFFFFSLVSS